MKVCLSVISPRRLGDLSGYGLGKAEEGSGHEDLPSHVCPLPSSTLPFLSPYRVRRQSLTEDRSGKGALEVIGKHLNQKCLVWSTPQDCEGTWLNPFSRGF